MVWNERRRSQVVLTAPLSAVSLCGKTLRKIHRRRSGCPASSPEIRS